MMNKSMLLVGIIAIIFVSAGIFVISNVHDVSACPNQGKTNGAAVITSPVPTLNNVNTLLSSPSLLQQSSSQPA